MIGSSLLTAFDLHLFNEGTHSHLYEKLGAHLMENGAFFAVWAPNADQVSVIGDFNNWDPGASPLQPRESSGIWEGFVGGAHHGSMYKFHIHSRSRAPMRTRRIRSRPSPSRPLARRRWSGTSLTTGRTSRG